VIGFFFGAPRFDDEVQSHRRHSRAEAAALVCTILTT
jgi:hypothetical protein